MTEQWQELKETITEMRDNDGTGTQQEVCKFLANLMDVLEKQMWEPCEDYISRQAVKELYYKDGYIDFRKICELPPVNPQSKTVHWIKVQDRPHHARCNNCNRVTAYAWGMDYCPRCGHRMEVNDGNC